MVGDDGWSCPIGVSPRSDVQGTGEANNDKQQGSSFRTMTVLLSWCHVMGMQSRCFNFELDVLWARYLKIDGAKKGKPAG
jgi:hypothetical protein